jgi:hypothetical protein
VLAIHFGTGSLLAQFHGYYDFARKKKSFGLTRL